MSYSLDPRWITARRSGIDAKGLAFTAGEKVFYYPLNRQIYAGENATVAAADFYAALFDEDCY